MIPSHTVAFSVGKYLVSPLIQRMEDGQFAPSVSIRSGQGRASHDRVVRFIPRFESREIAHRYAVREGLRWLRAWTRPLTN